MRETALVVLVPEVEDLVGPHRLRFDSVAAVGVPAHVTVLFPFRPVVDDATRRLVADLAAAVPAFEARFATMARFPGDVVYLAPDPAEPFRRLTAGAAAAFPDCPPYSGRVAEPVPHLTVANGVDEVTADAVERAVLPGLPVTSRIERLTLIGADQSGRWDVVDEWPLAGVATG